MFKWFQLFMSGKTYFEITNLGGAKYGVLLYVAYKSEWGTKKMEHYGDLVQNMSSKVKKVKLDSVNTIATMVTALGKFYGKKFDRYLTTGNHDIISGLDTKLLAQYYKSIDSLDKIVASTTGTPAQPSAAPIKIEESSDENVIDVGQEEMSVGSILSILAEAKQKKS